MVHPIHPMLVHFSIALLSASVLFDLVARRWRPEDCRVVSLYTLVMGVPARSFRSPVARWQRRRLSTAACPSESLKFTKRSATAQSGFLQD